MRATAMLAAACFVAMACIPTAQAEERIYFSSNRDAEKGKLQFSIYSMTADGKDVKRITDGKQNALDPALSPDGKELLYVVAAKKSAVIWLATADGDKAKRLTPDDEVAFAPAWSPDGKQIAYSVEPATKPSRRDSSIWLMNAKGGERTKVIDGAAPSWSGDGKRLLFTRFMEKEPPRPWEIELESRKALGLGGGGDLHRWSPGGHRIATVFATVHIAGASIALADGTGDGTTILEPTLAAQWTPDGRELLISYLPAVFEKRDPAKPNFRIRAIGMDKPTRDLTDGSSFDVLHGATVFLRPWEPDAETSFPPEPAK